MTAHQLAQRLLAGPNIPVIINGWGSDEGLSFQVSGLSPVERMSFNGVGDTSTTKRDALGYNLPRKALALLHGKTTPPSRCQIAKEKRARKQIERDRKRLTPVAFGLRYASPTSLKPSDLIAMAENEGLITKRLNS